jgi:hypothetical protein
VPKRRWVSTDGLTGFVNPPELLPGVAGLEEGSVELIGEASGECWRPLGTCPTHDDRGTGRLSGLWQSWRVNYLIVTTLKAVELGRWRGPKTVQDLELLFKAVEAFLGGRELEGICLVFCFIPTRTDT